MALIRALRRRNWRSTAVAWWGRICRGEQARRGAKRSGNSSGRRSMSGGASRTMTAAYKAEYFGCAWFALRALLLFPLALACAVSLLLWDRFIKCAPIGLTRPNRAR